MDQSEASGAGPIRVFLLDDHEVVRRGIREMLQDEGDIEVVGESGSAPEAARRIPALRPDVAVLDNQLPDGSGIDVCRTVRSQDPTIRALILTSFDDDDAVFAAIMAGADGYVLKQVRSADLVGSIRQVAAGRSILDPQVTARVMERVRNGPPSDPLLAPFTDQERRLLALIGQGLTNREIAGEMYLAEKTVKNYVSLLLGKLGLTSRTQAALFAQQHPPGVMSVAEERGPERPLLDAVVSVSSDLSLDGVLRRIVRAAADLADARYAALGVLASTPPGTDGAQAADDGGGRRLRLFLQHGLTPEQEEAIGDLPHGRGLLGHIIDHPEPIRLAEMTEHPHSVGFPPHHPPMGSLLGVPVRSRGRAFGNLYLTAKRGGRAFTQSDEDVVVALAAAAGVAVENARLYEEARRREDWLDATASVATEVARAGDPDSALPRVARRARLAAQADAAWVLLDGPDGPRVAGHDGDPTEHEPRGAHDDPVPEVLASRTAAWSWGPAPRLVVPLGSDGEQAGVLVLDWSSRSAEAAHTLDTALPAAYAEQVALAREVVRARADQQRLALLEDRDRIARDLHDVVIQRIFAVSLGLDSAARRVQDLKLAARLSRAVDDLDATTKDIRRTIFALHSSEDSGDVQSEVEHIVDRAAATLKYRPSLTLSGPVRTMIGPDLAPDVLAVLAEALSNASRHAGASAVHIELTVDDDLLLVVADDGAGLPGDVLESGLSNLRERAVRHGGSLELATPAGGGTRLVWRVPLRPA